MKRFSHSVRGWPHGVALVLLIVATAPVAARPIAFGFRGRVTAVFDGIGALPATVTSGIPYFGAYVFDSETPNTGEPIGEGELGIYHHDRPPAGVTLFVGRTVFASHPRRPDFDIFVANEYGFAGTDEYGFVSRNNLARGLLPSFYDRLELNWRAATVQDVFANVDLPLKPPDLNVLGGGQLMIEGECTPCLGPAAFFRITGTMTDLFTVPRVPTNFTWPVTNGVAERMVPTELPPSFIPEPALGIQLAAIILWAVLFRRM